MNRRNVLRCSFCWSSFFVVEKLSPDLEMMHLLFYDYYYCYSILLFFSIYLLLSSLYFLSFFKTFLYFISFFCGVNVYITSQNESQTSTQHINPTIFLCYLFLFWLQLQLFFSDNSFCFAFIFYGYVFSCSSIQYLQS